MLVTWKLEANSIRFSLENLLCVAPVIRYH